MLQPIKSEEVQLSSPQKVADLFREVFGFCGEEDAHKERFYVMGLNNKNTLLYIDLISLGTINAAPIYVRETVRQAIIKNASCIVICHNHPAGTCAPSEEDTRVTKKIMDACKLLDIAMVDHVILAGNKHFSFREEGLL